MIYLFIERMATIRFVVLEAARGCGEVGGGVGIKVVKRHKLLVIR